MANDRHGDEVRQVSPGYFVSRAGRVYSTHRKVRARLGRGFSWSIEPFEDYHRELRAGLDQCGYLQVNVGTTRKVSRLVLEAFCGPPPSDRHHAGHLDDDKRNNRIDNLAWQTPAENIRQQIDRRRHVHGTRTHTCVLSESDVRAIRADQRTLQSIAATYGISFGQVWKIKNRLSWRHVN